MKNKLKYLFCVLVIVLVTSSCSKDITPPTQQLPTGTFSGYFTADHLNSRTGKRDTTYEWVTLTLSAATGFTIKGDTTVRASTDAHAAGYGTYAQQGFQYMQFSDKGITANVSGKAKYHLNGLYIYADTYTGLSILGSSTDTLYLSYNLQPVQEPVK